MARRAHGTPKTLTVHSGAFEHGRPIPVGNTCDGRDLSPPLEIGTVPAGARALAIICEDEDAPRLRPWLHWSAWNVPASVTRLREGEDVATLGARQGRNDFGETRWRGPCPVRDTFRDFLGRYHLWDGVGPWLYMFQRSHHRLFIRVYALKEPLDVEDGAPFPSIRSALKGRVLAWGETMGTFSWRRPRKARTA